MGSNTQISPRLRVEVAEDVSDLPEVWHLRSMQFRAGRGSDRDAWDAKCRHVLIRNIQSGALVACFRMTLIDGPDGLANSYTARRYDMRNLAKFAEPMIEVGRFCLAQGHTTDPDVLRLAWAEITRAVDTHNVGLLFGCASFPGTDPAVHAAAFAQLSAYVAPTRWAIGQRRVDCIRLTDAAGGAIPSATAVPPMLRSYLAMGGFVSDHLVVDHDLGTLHVFAGLEVRAVPAARALALRRLAG